MNHSPDCAYVDYLVLQHDPGRWPTQESLSVEINRLRALLDDVAAKVAAISEGAKEETHADH